VKQDKVLKKLEKVLKKPAASELAASELAASVPAASVTAASAPAASEPAPEEVPKADDVKLKAALDASNEREKCVAIGNGLMRSNEPRKHGPIG
jgi:hypothetical protein